MSQPYEIWRSRRIVDASDEFTIPFEIIKHVHKPKPYEGRQIKGSLATTVPLGKIICQGEETWGGPTNRRMVGHPG